MRSPNALFQNNKIQAKWWFSTKHTALQAVAFAGFLVVLKFTGPSCLPHGHALRAAS
jgi:hypothetical protein